MGYSLENKVTYDELAPTLQALIDSKATIEELNKAESILNTIVNQIGSLRVTIGNNPPGNPSNYADIFFNSGQQVVYTFNDGNWHSYGGVYL